jgi:Flp pilus assembly protein TadB
MSTPHDTAADRRDESVAELVKDLSRDVSTLLHEEIALARAEMTEKGRRAGMGAGMFGAATAFGLVTLGGSMATIVILLDKAMPLWLAALLTTLVYGGVAWVLAMRGREELQRMGTPVPERATESVKEDIQWAKTHAKSNGR